MNPRSWPLALVIILGLARSPVWAGDSAERATAGQAQKDLCAYLKDVDAKTDSDCSLDAVAALKAQDPSAFAQKLELAARRRADVQKAYDRLKSSTAPDSPPAPANQGEPDPLQLQPPINDRTFPAWLGEDAPGLKVVYARWLKTQNDRLSREQQGGVTEQRQKEIGAQLARNEARISRLEKIKDPSELSCFLGEGCGTKTDVSGSAVQGLGSGRRWTAEDFSWANAREKIRTVVPGGKLDRGIPAQGGIIVPEAGTTAQRQPLGGLPLLPLGTAGLGLGLAGFGVYRAGKTWESQDGLDPKSDEPLAPARPPEETQGSSRGLLDVASDYVFRAKLFVEDHPHTSVGIGVSALALTATLAGPTLFAGGSQLLIGGGGAAALAPAAATTAAPAGAVTLSQAGPAVMAGGLLLMAGDSKRPDTHNDENSTTPADSNKRSFKLGEHKSAAKWQNQMKQRGWTEEQIEEAIEGGQKYRAPNKVHPENTATRYVHPETGRSVVIDDKTGEVLQVQGDGFKNPDY